MGRKGHGIRHAFDGQLGRPEHGPARYDNGRCRHVRCGERDRAWYRPFITQATVQASASKEAAAAVAAGTVLLSLVPADSKTAADIRAALDAYLADLQPGDAKTLGIKIGQEAANSVIKKCETDGSNAPDAYRPRTKPGVYVPTGLTVGSVWPQMKPFVLKEPAQFRPGPPVALESEEFARSYNELREYGGKASTKRSPEQSEIAAFWLMVGPQAYHPLLRQICTKKALPVVDCAERWPSAHWR